MNILLKRKFNFIKLGNCKVYELLIYFIYIRIKGCVKMFKSVKELLDSKKFGRLVFWYNIDIFLFGIMCFYSFKMFVYL